MRYEKLIEIDHITKDYGNGRGVFDVTLEIGCGEVFGFLGPNGAGKTTTIRQILGFISPDKGQITINGKPVQKRYYETNAQIGYLPGEINFPESMKGMELIHWIAELRGMDGLGRAPEIIDLFQMKNADSDVKRMSKGMIGTSGGAVCLYALGRAISMVVTGTKAVREHGAFPRSINTLEPNSLGMQG